MASGRVGAELYCRVYPHSIHSQKSVDQVEWEPLKYRVRRGPGKS